MRAESLSPPGGAFTEIPEVDLSEWDGAPQERAALADRMRRICHEVGFFTIVGHGVPAPFVDHYFDLMARFFALPEAEKAIIDKARSRHFRGWERVGAELTNNRPDIREQLDVSAEHPPYPADAMPPYLRLDGPNQWLPEPIVPGFRAAIEEFFSRMGSVAERLMEILCIGLGLEPNHLHDVFGERPLPFAKLISYPPTPPGQAGVNEHHDAGFLTILIQHGVGGLQAKNPDGDWIDVSPRPGAFVVNLGEMLQEMTGNYFVATTHRVIASQGRLSAGYFHGPDLRTVLDPLPLAPRFRAAVAASERHATAGFMATRNDLMAGRDGIAGRGAGVYGQQLWNYYVRSYPDNVALHYPDLV